jgi:hypothetical protein
MARSVFSHICLYITRLCFRVVNFLISIVGVESSWVHLALPAPVDYDDGKIGGMMIGRGNRSTRRKPAPVPLCPPKIPHAARTRTRAATLGSQ